MNATRRTFIGSFIGSAAALLTGCWRPSSPRIKWRKGRWTACNIRTWSAEFDVESDEAMASMFLLLGKSVNTTNSDRYRGACSQSLVMHRSGGQRLRSGRWILRITMEEFFPHVPCIVTIDPCGDRLGFVTAVYPEISFNNLFNCFESAIDPAKSGNSAQSHIEETGLT